MISPCPLKETTYNKQTFTKRATENVYMLRNVTPIFNIYSTDKASSIYAFSLYAVFIRNAKGPQIVKYTPSSNPMTRNVFLYNDLKLNRVLKCVMR